VTDSAGRGADGTEHVERADVVIVGGGPFGLMLAIELGRRGTQAILFDEKPSTTFNPQANATQARTMEHYRRLGFADEIRAMGLPPDYPTDVAYFTRFARHELARFSLPPASDVRNSAGSPPGYRNGPEPPHRVSQKFVEQILVRKAAALGGVSLRFGWRVVSFADKSNHVTAEAVNVETGERSTVTARYLAAGDGAHSFVRRRCGIRLEGETGVQRDFFGGRMLALYLRVPRFYDVVPHAPAWMHVTFNRDRRAFMCAVDGKAEFAFHTQLRDGEDEDAITDRDAIEMFNAAVGQPIEAEILSHGTWTAGHALVAERFQQGRVFLGGDAVHLFTPAGGLGYNTAVEDAVNLGWKFAATINGAAGPGLLRSYELERRPVAVRNTGYARDFAESLGSFVAKDGLEGDGEVAERLRREAGGYLDAHGRAEFNIPGITFGARYDDSPIIAGDGTTPPPDSPRVYVPSATPGGRAPHMWLSDGRSLYDLFGFEWTLLRLGSSPPDSSWLERAMARVRAELRVVEVASQELLDLYGAPLALIRPDQIVAWRGASDVDAESTTKIVTGT
jgi:2-polyprenyl-6-methoxyphenol hydroxylase-like FAD-dependent oxidoreductase